MCSVDKEFLQAAVIGQILLREQIPKMLQEDTTMFITRCILEDLRKGGREYKGAHAIGSSLPFLKCRHGKGLREPGACIWSLIGTF
jgi:U3 small nucleolar RNA-associated protein 23